MNFVTQQQQSLCELEGNSLFVCLCGRPCVFHHPAIEADSHTIGQEILVALLKPDDSRPKLPDLLSEDSSSYYVPVSLLRVSRRN
jgi:hypothetical protein